MIWLVLYSKSENQSFDILARLLSRSMICFSRVCFCLPCPKMTELGLMSCFFSLKSRNEDSDILARLLSKGNLPANYNFCFGLSVDLNISFSNTLLLLHSKWIKTKKYVLSPLLSKASTFMIHVPARPISKLTMELENLWLSFCPKEATPRHISVTLFSILQGSYQ